MSLGLDGIDASVAMVESIDDKKMIGIGKEIADNGNKIKNQSIASFSVLIPKGSSPSMYVTRIVLSSATSTV